MGVDFSRGDRLNTEALVCIVVGNAVFMHSFMTIGLALFGVIDVTDRQTDQTLLKSREELFQVWAASEIWLKERGSSAN